MFWTVFFTLSAIAVAAFVGYTALENRRLTQHLKDAPATYATRARALVASATLEQRTLTSSRGEQYVVGVYDNLRGQMLVWVRVTLLPNQIKVVVECSSACTGRAVQIADHMHNGFHAVGSDVAIEWHKPQPLHREFMLPSMRLRPRS